MDKINRASKKFLSLRVKRRYSTKSELRIIGYKFYFYVDLKNNTSQKKKKLQVSLFI